MLCRPEVADVLLNSENTVSAINALLEWKRAIAPSFTASNLAKRAKISRSYLSEVISGKKKITLAASNAISSGFGLFHLEAGYFDALCALDLAKSNEEKNIKIHELKLCARLLSSVIKSSTVPDGASLLAFDIYASIGMFGELGASFTELKKLFSWELGLDIQNALSWLISKKSVSLINEKYIYTQSGLVFEASEGKQREEIWKSSLLDANKNIGKYTDKECFFASYSVTVESKEFEVLLAGMKKLIYKEITNMDSKKADTLLRVNMQLYPTARKI
jgi:transcriptional regulator with XRE-family HTH domain